MKMKINKLVLVCAMIVLLISSIASAATVLHKAEQIKPGVFGRDVI
jgi:hypothetical protein